MSKRRGEVLRALCGQCHPDDGVDPREERRIRRGRKSDRKLRQLCKQVERVVQLSLSELPQAELLAEAIVRGVIPAPNAGCLCVLCEVTEPSLRDSVQEALEQSRGQLRAEVARAINRRRAPDLTFAVTSPGGEHG